MRRYRVVNPERFEVFRTIVHMFLWILAVVMFVRFINAHSGLNMPKQTVTEYHTYEVVYETSRDDSRIKEPALREVVWRYVER
jgi:hypothetical protein